MGDTICAAGHDAVWYFNLPEDGFWKGTVELTGPQDIRAVHARYTFKNIGRFEEMYQAIRTGGQP